MMTQTIDNFAGHYAFLSNFYMRPLVWEGRTWKSSEHAFNGAKTLLEGERQWVADAKTAGEAKRRGRVVTLRDDWDKHWRYVLMYDIVRTKFRDDAVMGDRLISTHDAILVEGNKWHDGIWGVCRCGKCPAGRNSLGIILMQIRFDLIRGCQ
jgi:ribA/ribD-fused uncharacterized protein